MSLPVNHTLFGRTVTAYTPSCAATPVAAYVSSPQRGFIEKFTGVLGGAITVADATITVAVNGTTIGTFALTQAGSAAGKQFTGAPSSTANQAVNEDDVISFTPSGATGASIPAFFSVTVRAG